MPSPQYGTVTGGGGAGGGAVAGAGGGGSTVFWRYHVMASAAVVPNKRVSSDLPCTQTRSSDKRAGL